jgi:hypothetical protein
MSLTSRAILLAVLLYGGGYLVFRTIQTERWERDGRAYVIFPASGVGKGLYYGWRPLSYLDTKLTGTQTHIGPHRD